MYANLPEAIKQQVLCLLQGDNFVAAKQMHDDWLDGHLLVSGGGSAGRSLESLTDSAIREC